MAGLAGGAISLQDAARAEHRQQHRRQQRQHGHRGRGVLGGEPEHQSNPQPAGIVSRAHSAALTAQIGTGPLAGPLLALFANPCLVNNIVLGNRVFFFDTVDVDPTAPTFVLADVIPSPPVCRPRGRRNGLRAAAEPSVLPPRFHGGVSLEQQASGRPRSSRTSYLQRPVGQQVIPEAGPDETLRATPAFDEGGNFIDVRYRAAHAVTRRLPPVARLHLFTTGSPPRRSTRYAQLPGGFSAPDRRRWSYPTPRTRDVRPARLPDIGADEKTS